jgi:hypothetical protein
MLVYLVIVLLAGLAWMILTSKQTLVLHNQRFITTYDSTTFLLKNEQVFYFDNDPAPVVPDGTRVSKQKVLFESDAGLSAYWMEQQALLQRNPTIPTKIELFKQLVDMKDAAQSFQTEEEKNLWLKEFKASMNLLAYADLGEEKLSQKRASVSARASESTVGKTLSRLGGAFSGYLYYGSDGFEPLLTLENLEALVDVPQEDLSEMAELMKTDQRTVKVVNDDTGYMMVSIPEDTLLDLIAKVDTQKAAIRENMEDPSLLAYLDRLNRRVDLLRSMPTIGFILEEEEYTASVVEVLKPSQGEGHVLLLQLKDRLTGEFLKRRSMEIKLVTYDNEGYVVPKKSLFEKDGKTYMTVMNKGYLRKNLEVHISATEGDQVFLSRRDNEEITEGTQLIVHP